MVIIMEKNNKILPTEENYSFADFWSDIKHDSKKRIAFVAYCAIDDLINTGDKVIEIINYMDNTFSGDWSTTDMAPVWKIYDMLKEVLDATECYDEEVREA